MDVLEVIQNRRSIRRFTGQPLDKETVRALLRAGMAGPSCVNARDWSFVAVTDPQTLQRMAEANGRPADPLRGAALGVLVCGDLQRAFARAKDYWVIDGAVAAQNMLLAAAGMGIGGVWLGTWPQMDRVERQRQLFGLPAHIVPHSVLAFGYPAEIPQITDRPDWEEDRVHFERW